MLSCCRENDFSVAFPLVACLVDHRYLDSLLAERTSVHGVLMDIYGMGVLIQGDSGIVGKSGESGLELPVKRGHRLQQMTA